MTLAVSVHFTPLILIVNLIPSRPPQLAASFVTIPFHRREMAVHCLVPSGTGRFWLYPDSGNLPGQLAGQAMFIVESRSGRAARKMSYLMAFVLLLAPGALLTMHFYIRPRPPAPPGWRVFGFPRRR
jgi:hypothetical protein